MAMMTSPAPGTVELNLTREFDAPRDLVFRAWTEAGHFARWFGPAEATMPFCAMDARPGGILHFCHRMAGHPDTWVRCVFREVAAPERLVFALGFSDADGNEVERPDFARESEVTVTFAEHDGRTTMHLRHGGLVADRGESQGWAEGLDRLDAYLAGA